MANNSDGPRVEGRRGYNNLRSRRRVEYDSPLVSRVPRSPARDVDDMKVGEQAAIAKATRCIP